MNPNWNEFIQASSTTTKALHPQFAALTNFGVLTLEGNDTKTFLQGQATCDVNNLSTQQAVYGALCDAKGRVQVTFLLFLHHEQLFLVVTKSMLAFTLKRLKKFAMFSKIEVKDVSHIWCISGSWQAEASTQAIFTQTQANGILQIHFPDNRTLLLCDQSKLMINHYKKTIDDNALLIGDIHWLKSNIFCRFATIEPKTSGLFTPQMIELEKWHGVSFSKGCYVGQEIIARTQYLGKLKRHLQLINSTPLKDILPGDAIVDGKGHSAGVIVNSYLNSALAVIEDKALEQPLFLDHQQPIEVL